MDWSNIIIAIIGGAITLIGYVIVDKREKNKQLDAFKKEVVDTLNEHRTEYIKGIEDVKDNIAEIKAVYQQNSAIVELKIDALEKKQDAHNNVITRVFNLESGQKLQEEQIKIVNHRIEDLERK